MAVYTANNSLGGSQQATAAAYKTQLSLTGLTASLTRALVQEVDVGTNGTPADNYLEYDISRQTTAVTGTGVTPVPTDGLIRAAGTVATACYTAEPTVTAASSMFYLALNQRASYRWVAAPGSELVVPATNVAGVGLRARSAAYTGTVTAMMIFVE